MTGSNPAISRVRAVRSDKSKMAADSLLSSFINALELSQKAKYAEFFFNPLFAKEIPRILPKMKDAGFSFETFEYEDNEGTHIHARVQHGNDVLDLGELVFSDTVSESGLQPIVKLVNFVSSHIKST